MRSRSSIGSFTHNARIQKGCKNGGLTGGIAFAQHTPQLRIVTRWNWHITVHSIKIVGTRERKNI
jgi:hypothetical protein